MKIIFFLLFCCTRFLTACSQQDTAEQFRSSISYRQFAVGQSTISIRSFSFETETPFLLLQLHSDEATAAEAATELAHKWGIQFVQILNQQTRLVTFMHGGRWFQFDPNRMFSEEGIRKTLQLSGAYTDAAFLEVKQFSDSLLSIILQDKPIVAVHNNTDGRFNILQYSDARIGQVHLNPEHDEDDFFITNDEEIFHLLKAENFNVVLEDASQMDDDGSLSLYCGKKGIRYINVEAQHGHRKEQKDMLEVVMQILK